MPHHGRKTYSHIGVTAFGGSQLTVGICATGLIASLMFGGYGLGWFDEFGELALIPMSIGIYMVTVLLVGLYTKRFGCGFLEPVLREISGR